MWIKERRRRRVVIMEGVLWEGPNEGGGGGDK